MGKPVRRRRPNPGVGFCLRPQSAGDRMSTAPPGKFALRPQERRLVAFVLVAVFVLLNMWLVWPHFGDWSQIQAKQERARKTHQLYQAEIAKTSGYRVKLRELES